MSEISKAILVGIGLCAAVLVVAAWRDLPGGLTVIYLVIFGVLLPAFTLGLRSGHRK